MKMVRLKEGFIKKATAIDPEFEQKHWRGYAIVITNGRLEYLVPLRSKCNHPYCYKNEVSGKFLDYSKSFELINKNIILSIYTLDSQEYLFYKRNIREISKELIKFNKMRNKYKYSVNNDKIKKIQSDWK